MPDKNIRKNEKKRTLFLILILVVFSLVVHLIFRYRYDASSLSSEDLVVVVEAEGRQLYAVPLTDEVRLPVITGSGENVVRIEDGVVSMESADCKNQICVQTAAISQPGETIVCLPHRVVVSVSVRKKE